MKAWDLGGHDQVRTLWKDYFVETDAIVFVVDSADSDRFDEAKKELEMLLKEPHLSNCTLLILGNKIDLITSAPANDLIRYLGIENALNDENSKRKIKVLKKWFCIRYGYRKQKV